MLLIRQILAITGIIISYAFSVYVHRRMLKQEVDESDALARAGLIFFFMTFIIIMASIIITSD